MRKRAHLMMIFVALVIVSGCNKLRPGWVSETYVYERDANRVLELRGKEGVKEMIHGRSISPYGDVTLRTDQKVLGGTFRIVEAAEHPAGTEPHAYVINVDNKESKLFLVAGETALRDADGNIWRLQGRSRTITTTRTMVARLAKLFHS
jgi:hypothetical protein